MILIFEVAAGIVLGGIILYVIIENFDEFVEILKNIAAVIAFILMIFAIFFIIDHKA